MENRKNTILLTVIAVATLLVAVVGATFAYFTAQGNGGASRAVTVTTHTTDSATFAIDGVISVDADQDTFGSGDGDAVGTTTATATFKAGNAAAADMCYTVTLEVTTNNFIKCSSDTTPDGNRTLCSTNSTVTDKNAKELAFTAKKGDTVLVDAADITVGTANVQVPTAKNGTDYQHKISAAAGQELTDNWTFEVKFINLDQDQGYNAGKGFVGALKFTQVECAS